MDLTDSLERFTVQAWLAGALSPLSGPGQRLPGSPPHKEAAMPAEVIKDGFALGESIGLGILEEETDAGAILLFRELRLANAMQAKAAGVFPAEARAETIALLALCARLNPEATRDACAQISEWNA